MNHKSIKCMMILRTEETSSKWGLEQYCAGYLSWAAGIVVLFQSLPMDHHLGFIVFLSVCGETTRCVGGGQSFITVYLLHAWTILRLCVGQTPGETGRWNYCQRRGQHQYCLPLCGQVPDHYLGDLRTRIPLVWAVQMPVTLADR